MQNIPNGNYELVGEEYINGRMEGEGLLVMMCLLVPFLSLTGDQSSPHTVWVLSNRRSQYNSL